MSMMELKHIVKCYGSLKVVDDVSLSIASGDQWAIIGESGSGKTTLAKIMMGLIKSDGGSITRNVPMQMVFQDPYHSLDPFWNVAEILKEALWAAPLSKTEVQERMEQMLYAVGLGPSVLGRFPHEFSGGERQRIAIARALLVCPQVLILDEAVSSLDSLTQKQIMDLLRRLRQEFKLTTIFISHNLRLVRNFSDKIAVMYQGKIVESAQATRLFDAPEHPYTRQLLQAAFYGI